MTDDEKIRKLTDALRNVIEIADAHSETLEGDGLRGHDEEDHKIINDAGELLEEIEES